MSAVPVRWGPSDQGRALLAVAAVGVGLALVLRDGALLALAAPAVWSLLTTARSAEATTVVVRSPLPQLRGQEREQTHVEVAVELDVPVAHLAGALALPSTFAGAVEGEARGARSLLLSGAVVPGRWGRHPLGPVRVDLLAPGGLRSARVDVRLGLRCLVVPAPLAVTRSSAPAVLPNRFGEHVTRTSGHGVEPVAVRAYASGDPIRRVNWRVSSRRQQLHVTVAASERAVDLVIVIDGLSDVGSPPDTSLDRAVRAGAGLAGRWLRDRDRVGLLVLGGTLRWLTPGQGRDHLQRVVESVLWAASPPGSVSPQVGRVPRTVLPSGAVIVFLTPLLDPRAIEAVAALRQRSSRVLVVDVLGGEEPPVGRRDEIGHLAVRLWRLERNATRDRLLQLGTPVLEAGDAELDRLVAAALRRLR